MRCAPSASVSPRTWTPIPSSCRADDEEAHPRQSSAAHRAGAGQSSGRRADLPERQVHVRRRRRDATLLAGAARGLLLLEAREPDIASTRARARGLAGARWLPAHGVGRRRHHHPFADADQGRRSRRLLCRALRPDTRADSPRARPVRRHENAGFDR